MSNKLKKLFNTIINNDNENNEINHDDEYILIIDIDELIKGSHIRIKIASKILYTGFYVMSKKSLIRDQNTIIIKTDRYYKEIPFYKHKVYQRDLRNIKKKSVFENNEIRDDYLKNISRYIKKNNEEDKLI